MFAKITDNNSINVVYYMYELTHHLMYYFFIVNCCCYLIVFIFWVKCVIAQRVDRLKRMEVDFNNESFVMTSKEGMYSF